GPDAHASIEPLRIPSRIWSLATLHAEGPTPPTFAIALGTLDNQLTAQLTGLPENARVLAARVLHDDQPYALTTTTPADPMNELRFQPVARASSAFNTTSASEKAMAAFAVLAGEPSKRTPAVIRLQRAGWARVDVLIENPPATSTFTTDDDATRTRVALYRILTPMPEAGPTSTSEATP
ncbi:MAG: hypothetical protein AAFN41_09585, partial [Planctomycetota bacterium]